MDELINDFIAETREMLQALSGAIVAWEAHPGDAARLDEIFRFVHTVKGNCGFFDLPRLAQLSHAARRAGRGRSGTRTAETHSSMPCSPSSTGSGSWCRRWRPGIDASEDDDN